jgi:hypothetical protein
VYKDVSYVLDDDSYAAADYQDTVRKRFTKYLEGLLDGYKVRHWPGIPSEGAYSYLQQSSFTEANFRLFFGLIIDTLVRPWEKYVMTLKFNEVSRAEYTCYSSLTASSLAGSDAV